MTLFTTEEKRRMRTSGIKTSGGGSVYIFLIFISKVNVFEIIGRKLFCFISWTGNLYKSTKASRASRVWYLREEGELTEATFAFSFISEWKSHREYGD